MDQVRELLYRRRQTRRLPNRDPALLLTFLGLFLFTSDLKHLEFGSPKAAVQGKRKL
jgi:hypothetical protein